MNNLLRLANDMGSQDRRFQYSAKFLRQQLGFETSATAALVLETESFFGTTSTSIAFGSEASIFTHIADEVIVFGPGDMQTAHSDRECVPISELNAAAAYLLKMMAVSRPGGR